jgi:hypothetical protein
MDDRNMDASTSVVIGGGGLNGPTMAMLLARRRVPCLALERLCIRTAVKTGGHIQ